MGIPKEPRQQMINMMYLFLTAMLALNVSAEILRAFSIVTVSLEKTSSTIKDKNDIIMQQFEKKMQDDPDKTRDYYNKAKQVREYSKELADYILEMKTLLVDEAGNKNKKIDDQDYEPIKEPGIKRVKNEADLDISSRMLLVERGGRRGKDMKAKINDIREKLLAIVSDKMTEEQKKNYEANFPLLLASDVKMEGSTKTWQQSNFGEVPLAAAVTLLTKYEADVRNAESEILSYLLNAISAADFKFDEIKAVIIPNSRYVMQGGEYRAEIFTAAYSSTQEPIIIVGDVDSNGNVTGPDTMHVPVKGGIGEYIVSATGVGNQTYSGVVMLKDPSGDGFQKFPFTQEWSVMVGQAVVSPTKMNVLYIGVDNPLAISAAGFTADKVKPSISGSGGNLKPDAKKGEYLATVTSVGTAIVTVSAEMEDGTVKKVGAQEFRVNRVPDPVATLGKKYVSGKIEAHVLKAQRGMVADLKDFVFDLRFNVISFEMTFAAKGADLVKSQAVGPVLTDQMVGIISRAKKGDLIFFDEIKVRGPDNIPRKLPGLAFEVI